jgi:hypothetical protein
MQTPDKRYVCFLAENGPDSQLSSPGRWKPLVTLDCNFVGTQLPAILEWIVETCGREERGVEIALLKQVYWGGGADN